METGMKCYNCGSGAGLSRSGDKIFISGDFAQSHRASGVKFLCGDADFSPEAKLGAVGETCGEVDIDARGIDHPAEPVGGDGVSGDDALRLRVNGSIWLYADDFPSSICR